MTENKVLNKWNYKHQDLFSPVEKNVEQLAQWSLLCMVEHPNWMLMWLPQHCEM